jgi:4-hydroxybenzoate polyprenyltransferase
MRIFINGLSYGAAIMCGGAAGEGSTLLSGLWFCAAVALSLRSTDMLKRLCDE